MNIGSGLAAQVGIAEEDTYGTAETVDHFLEFNSESVDWTKNTLQGQGLHAGGQYNREARRVVSTVDAGGDLMLDHALNGMLLLWKHALGVATGPTPTTTPATKTIFTPGPLQGLGLTYQIGVPQTDGTVEAFTFRGGKITAWKFSISDGQIAQLNPTFNFLDVDVATALAAASYLTGNGVYNFSQAAIKLGGTASTDDGVTSITGGVAPTTILNSYELNGTNPMKIDRYGLGNAGVKAEPIENDYRTLTGTLGGEFHSRSELWDLFHADTGVPLQLTITGPVITGTEHNTLDIILPAVKFDTGPIDVSGPDVVASSLDFTVLDDSTNPPIQVTINSSDTAL